MKKIFVYTFLCLLLLNWGGYHAFLIVEQEMAKQEVKAKLLSQYPKESFVKFSFSTSQLSEINWEEKNKEFWMNGELYDIARIETSQNETIFYCISDKKEAAIKAKIRFLTKQNPLQKRTLDSFLKIIFQKYTPPQHIDFQSVSLIFFDKNLFPHFFNNLRKTFILLHSPPPEI